MANFLVGGRMGDLIHMLYVVKNTPGKHDIFITDKRELHSDGFLYPLEHTYKELLPILTGQEWCNELHIYSHDVPEIINLNLWRRYAYSASWTELFSTNFNVPVNGDAWINIEPLPNWYKIIAIHSSVHEARRGHQWDVVMELYNGQCIFIGSDEERAAFKFSIPHIKPETLSDYFRIIKSCKFFIGNQSAPLAMAHAMGVPRLAMLNEIDKAHYVGEERFCKNFYWIADGTHYFEGINY